MTTNLIPRPTVVQMVATRDQALVEYGLAHDALVAAHRAVVKAKVTAGRAAPATTNRYNHHSEGDRRYFLKEDDVPSREDFMAEARRLTDIDVWAGIIAATDLERLMDKKAKDEFNDQLVRDPPEVTVDNVFATLQNVLGDADNIFRRGVAECFSNLDRRFKSHDGWKIGSRIILSNAFGDTGHWNYYRNQRDTLQDIERAFFVMEGRTPPANYAGIVGAVEEARKGGWGVRQTEVDSEFFLLRIYMNGNCHVWFKRDDLLEKVNKLLGEYYGDVIPEERGPEDDGGLNTPKTSLAKNFGFFPTPPEVVARMIDATSFYSEDEPRTVLEPSAGTGNLAMACVEEGAVVDCVEVQRDLVKQLAAQGKYRKVYRGDFLSMNPDPHGLYDLVVMNPPFDRERDIDHVVHALKFLKPGGSLTAIMSAGTEFRTTRKSEAFRNMVKKMHGSWRDLPAGSFSSEGTNVNTMIVRINKNRLNPYF